MNILWINACAHEDSRTLKLTEAFIESYRRRNDAAVKEVTLFDEQNLHWFNWEKVIKRDELQRKEQWSDEMFDYARDWAEADRIIISAPYWDLSFPAVLKVYFENIFVTGLTFRYEETGAVRGLSRADKLLYVTTCGGMISGNDLGYDYVKASAAMFGINEVDKLAAEGLDIKELDSAQFLLDSIQDAEKMAQRW